MSPGVERAVRLYAWIMKIYPSRYRERSGAEELLTFRTACEQAVRTSGMWGLARVIGRCVFWDLMRSAMTVRAVHVFTNALSGYRSSRMASRIFTSTVLGLMLFTLMAMEWQKQFSPVVQILFGLVVLLLMYSDIKEEFKRAGFSSPRRNRNKEEV